MSDSKECTCNGAFNAERRGRLCGGCEADLRSEVSRLRAAVRDLRVALDDLWDNQNGPPLLTYADSWGAAMDQVRAVMERTAGLASAPESVRVAGIYGRSLICKCGAGAVDVAPDFYIDERTAVSWTCANGHKQISGWRPAQGVP